jgi:hypothetical protein
LAEALRRGLIDLARYDQGIRQGRMRDEWASLMRELAVRLPSPEQAITALVEGQLTEADARAKYHEFGGDPKQFDWVFGTVGAAPSPVEAGTLANRGIIPWTGAGLGVTSFEQAVREGHSRNKWLPAWRALAVYLPPPRTITALVREGALTHEQATALFRDHGLSPDMATAYLDAATHQKTAHHKLLAESHVKGLYTDHLIPKPEAVTFLEALGYTATDADFVVSLWDVEIAATFTRHAVSKIHTLYVARRFDQATARSALGSLNVPGPQMDAMLNVWDHERAANVKTLTTAEIVAAWDNKVMSEAEAIEELAYDGWSAYDAWVLLSNKNKQPLPGKPARTVP